MRDSLSLSSSHETAVNSKTEPSHPKKYTCKNETLLCIYITELKKTSFLALCESISLHLNSLPGSGLQLIFSALRCCWCAGLTPAAVKALLESANSSSH